MEKANANGETFSSNSKPCLSKKLEMFVNIQLGNENIMLRTESNRFSCLICIFHRDRYVRYILTSDVMVTFMYLLPLVTSRSPTNREPESGETIPVSMLIVVLFPAPLWPSNTVISLVIAENDNPSTARLTSPFQGLHNWFMGRPRTVHRPYGS